ncbi:hypothetical protein [Natronomonas gomsonensis]|uniref:hypothetical protein n=1 Tax=Natronomonas gomsonensis TaxID=1046043 RepID=UPI0015BA3FD2|nr:hypothetical protein [Natronomonas gomsonensis]
MELTLDVDDDTGAVLERRADEHGFDSIEEYAETVLSLVMNELENDTKRNEEVESRLEDLGYLS